LQDSVKVECYFRGEQHRTTLVLMTSQTMKSRDFTESLRYK